MKKILILSTLLISALFLNQCEELITTVGGVPEENLPGGAGVTGLTSIFDLFINGSSYDDDTIVIYNTDDLNFSFDLTAETGSFEVQYYLQKIDEPTYTYDSTALWGSFAQLISAGLDYTEIDDGQFELGVRLREAGTTALLVDSVFSFAIDAIPGTAVSVFPKQTWDIPQGESFIIALQAHEFQNVAGAYLELEWDISNFTFEGGGFSDWSNGEGQQRELVQFSEVTQEASNVGVLSLNFSYINDNQGLNGDGAIVFLQFNASGSPGNGYQFQVRSNNYELRDLNNNPLTIQNFVGKTINIQ
jgi:hypothetical protein